VNEALYAVVNEEKGTAFPVRDRTLDVAGKTGTAQTGYVNPGNDDPKKAWYLSRDHAWFAAYSPAKAPEVAVIVLIEHGGSGPTQAAPVAMQVIKEYHRLQAQRAAKLAAAGKKPGDPKGDKDADEKKALPRDPPPPDPNGPPAWLPDPSKEDPKSDPADKDPKDDSP